MKKTAKILVVALIVTMLGIMCFGCAKKEESKIRVAGLKGPTTMGMVKMMQDDAALENPKYEFTMAATADEITPKLLRGEIDLAAIPSNLAPILYQKSNGNIQVLSTNTLGVVYIATNDQEVRTVADLKGREIYATGKGAVPEYVLRYVLEKNGISPDKDVSIIWKNEPTEVVALMQAKSEAYEMAVVMLPQPFMTAALNQTFHYEQILDLTMEWVSVSEDSMPVTGVLVGNKDFIKDNKEEVNAFLDEYESSINYVNLHAESMGEVIESYGIVKADIATAAIPYCKLEYFEGENMKKLLQSFYEALFEMEPDSVGGQLPDDKFYYKRK